MPILLKAIAFPAPSNRAEKLERTSAVGRLVGRLEWGETLRRGNVGHCFSLRPCDIGVT